MTIGTNDDPIDNTNPVMQGYNYGLEIASGKTVTVYDGIFKGNVNTNNKAINDESGVIVNNATIVHTNETIDNIQYDVAYLEDISVNITVNFNKNGGDTVEYNSKTLTEIGPIGNLPTATKANSEFLGWFTAGVGGERKGAAQGHPVALYRALTDEQGEVYGTIRKSHTFNGFAQIDERDR